MKNEEDSDQLRDGLNASQHFLTDTEMENGRHKVFSLQFSKLDPNLDNEKLHQVIEKLDCAAKINIALGFVLRNIETGEHKELPVSILRNIVERNIADIGNKRRKNNKVDISAIFFHQDNRIFCM